MENDSVGDPFGELKAKITENLHEFRNFRFMRRHSVEKDVKDDGTLSFIFQPHTFRLVKWLKIVIKWRFSALLLLLSCLSYFIFYKEEVDDFEYNIKRGLIGVSLVFIAFG